MIRKGGKEHIFMICLASFWAYHGWCGRWWSFSEWVELIWDRLLGWIIPFCNHFSKVIWFPIKLQNVHYYVLDSAKQESPEVAVRMSTRTKAASAPATAALSTPVKALPLSPPDSEALFDIASVNIKDAAEAVNRRQVCFLFCFVFVCFCLFFVCLIFCFCLSIES